MSYAAYRASIDLFPRLRTIFDGFMIELGYDPSNTTTDPATPVGVGNTVCNAVLNFRHYDGSNQLGNISTKRIPYEDYTGYTPVNEPADVPIPRKTVIDPDRFQPILYPLAIRSLYPIFVGAHWFKVVPFAGPYNNEISLACSNFPRRFYGSAEYIEQARELINISENLTDKQKVISEYWTDGPNSELPPGHWCLFAQFVSTRDNHTLDDDAKFFFILTNALMDAGIAAWTTKREQDSVRPITAIPYIYAGRLIKAWGGPRKGTRVMDGANWIPYQPSYFATPPFPEYPSGHSAFSAAGARILQLWTNSDNFAYSFAVNPGSSKIEPGLTPHSIVQLHWPTFTEAAAEAGMSRRYGGIHFRAGDLAGRDIGRLVADKVWLKAKTYFGDDK